MNLIENGNSGGGVFSRILSGNIWWSVDFSKIEKVILLDGIVFVVK